MNLDKSDLVEIITTKLLPVVAILAVVVIFFVMVSDANKPETPPTAPQATAANPVKDRQKQMAQMQEIIQHSDGNWDHLSAADQQVINGVTGGHGRNALRMMVKRAKSMSKKMPPSPKAHP